MKWEIVQESTLQEGPSEDAHIVQMHQGVPFIAMVDGHGKERDVHGKFLERSTEVRAFAQGIATRLSELFGQCLQPSQLPAIFDVAHRELDHWRGRLVALEERGLSTLGASVSALTIVGDQIHFVQAGDCPLYRLDQRGLHRLTRDHHPQHPHEANRLKSFIDRGEIEVRLKNGAHRVYRSGFPLGLMLTRSFGDWAYGDAVTHRPEVQVFPFDPQATYALCSDGGAKVLEASHRQEELNHKNLRSTQRALYAEAVLPDDDVTIVLFQQ